MERSPFAALTRTFGVRDDMDDMVDMVDTNAMARLHWPAHRSPEPVFTSQPDADLVAAARAMSVGVRNDIVRALEPFAGHAIYSQVLAVVDADPVERALAALAAGADPRAGGNALLRAACERGDAALVGRLLAPRPEGGGLTAADVRQDNCAALGRACASGAVAVVDMLFGTGLGADDARAAHALASACARGHHGVVARLRQAGLVADDAFQTLYGGDEPIILACAAAHVEVVALLLAPPPEGYGLADRAAEFGASALASAIFTDNIPVIVDQIFAAAPALATVAAARLEATASKCLATGHVSSAVALFRKGVRLTPRMLCFATATEAILDCWGGTPELEAAERALRPADLSDWLLRKQSVPPMA